MRAARLYTIKMPAEVGAPLIFPLGDREPASLTRDEILQALRDAPRVYEYGRTRIGRISDSVAVKYGPIIELGEARTMRYVAENSHVRLPRVHDFWESEDALWENDSGAKTCRTGYIVMDFIQGDKLADVWSSLSSDECRSILE